MRFALARTEEEILRDRQIAESAYSIARAVGDLEEMERVGVLARRYNDELWRLRGA